MIRSDKKCDITMPNKVKDIVDRIKNLIYLNDSSSMDDELSDAINEIIHLREERDEARREVCKLKSCNFEEKISPQSYASLRKWNCFGQEDHK